MIVVFDSNIWISALRFGGAPLSALRLAYVRDTIACCRQIEIEVERILQVKFGIAETYTTEVMMALLDRSLRVDIAGNVHGVCRDKDDDMVIECALTASAEAIVTGDKDLLSLIAYSGIRIVSVTDYLG